MSVMERIGNIQLDENSDAFITFIDFKIGKTAFYLTLCKINDCWKPQRIEHLDIGEYCELCGKVTKTYDMCSWLVGKGENVHDIASFLLNRPEIRLKLLLKGVIL